MGSSLWAALILINYHGHRINQMNHNYALYSALLWVSLKEGEELLNHVLLDRIKVLLIKCEVWAVKSCASTTKLRDHKTNTHHPFSSFNCVQLMLVQFTALLLTHSKTTHRQPFTSDFSKSLGPSEHTN